MKFLKIIHRQKLHSHYDRSLVPTELLPYEAGSRTGDVRQSRPDRRGCSITLVTQTITQTLATMQK